MKNEGNDVGYNNGYLGYLENNPITCGRRCDETDNCNSFAFCFVAKGIISCYLKDKILNGDEETKDEPSNCASYRKIGKYS